MCILSHVKSVLSLINQKRGKHTSTNYSLLYQQVQNTLPYQIQALEVPV